jgi:glutamate-1-semialdehyde 2,1-aminomutase
VAAPAGLHVSGRGSLMTIHPAQHPVIASVPLTEAESAVKELVFFGLVNRGFWLARRGMMTVSIPTTDAMCDELVAAFTDVVTAYGAALADR